MRDIKFRGKNKEGKWSYGTGVVKVIVNCKETNALEIIQSVDYDELDYYVPNYDSEEIRPDTIGQYTGLKDKNGKEIYEGDIILTQPFRDKPYSKNYKEKRLKGIVEYNIKCGNNFYGCEGKMKYWGAEWHVEIIDKEDYKKFSNYDWGKFFECEVIGNIYENKNLLEKG